MKKKWFKNKKELVFLGAVVVALLLATIVASHQKREQKPTCRDFSPSSYSYDSKIDYVASFNDLQPEQLAAAKRCGISPLPNRREIESQPELVEIATCDEYIVDKLDYSSPYLTRDAAEFLRQLGALTNQYAGKKGKRIIVTSVLRTEEDVRRLQRTNMNATTQSCHQFGTTFDITYTRFGRSGRIITDRERERMQHALYAAAYDMRKSGFCFVKYERKQHCLHITLRPEEL